MYQFTVSDMTCGHCAGTITKALKGLSPDEVLGEISEAGYTPRLES